METLDTQAVETLAGLLKTVRKKSGLSQERVAAEAGISASYYTSIESGRCRPPPGSTLSRILGVLHCNEAEAEVMREIASSERGFTPQDAVLPDDVQRLIGDLRAHGPKLPSRFIRALRTTIREAVD